MQSLIDSSISLQKFKAIGQPRPLIARGHQQRAWWPRETTGRQAHKNLETRLCDNQGQPPPAATTPGGDDKEDRRIQTIKQQLQDT